MSVSIPAKVFRTFEGQAVSIPPGFELPGTEASIRRDGPRLVIEPLATRPRHLAELLATLPSIEDDFGSIDKLPAEPVGL